MLQEKPKPAYDELTLAKLLEAAYVVQEHNRKLLALGLRVLPQEEDRTNQNLQEDAPAENLSRDKHRAPAEMQSAPLQAVEESAVAAKDDYTLTLARIVETQHQIQLRGLDLDQVITMVAQRVTAIGRADGAAVAMLHGARVRYKAVSGPMAPPADQDIPAEKALCAPALRGQIIRCRDLEVEFALGAEECRRRGIQAMIAVPIYQVGGVAGSLELYYASKHAFSEQDVHTCQLMAGLVTEALGRGDERNWKNSLASERSAMLEALEKLKPELAALVSTADGTASAKHAIQTPMSDSSCRKCGNTLVQEEQFCGQCGWPRGAEHDRQPAAPIWVRQPALAKNAPLNGAQTATEGGSALRPTFSEDRPEQALADSIEREMPELFAAPPIATDRAGVPPVDASAEAGAENQSEEETSGAVLSGQHASAWTSAAATREFLEQVAAAKPANALVRFWNARRGDFYLAVAVILVACVIRWGIWSNHPVSATAKPPAPTVAQQKPAPDADLSLFDRILIKLGLAVPPEAPESKGNPDTPVWVDLHTGLYYCPGTELYGKTPKGKLATQRDAQLDQYEPAYQKACE